MCLKGKNMLEIASKMGLLLTPQANTTKEAMYGITIYSDKVYLYCQLSMKTASMILIMHSSLELGRQNTFIICELSWFFIIT